MKVLIADDHALIREGVKRTLAADPRFTITGEAASHEEVLSAFTRERWDLLVLDINLAGKSGLEVLKTIRRLYPEVRVLVLSMYPVEQYAVRVLKAGASGYVNKGSSGQELSRALKIVADGGRYISAEVADRLAETVGEGAHRDPHELLSDREFHVLELLGRGKTITEIAHMLDLSVKTVSTYRSHILDKLGLRNTAEIMQYALMHRIAD
jgi:DNA-binding NarL/FixJ family response regulator